MMNKRYLLLSIRDRLRIDYKKEKQGEDDQQVKDALLGAIYEIDQLLES